MGRDPRGPDVDVGAFRGWLHDELARNAPWNEVVTELLTAIGRNSAGGARREAEANEGAGGAPTGVHGAVNWTLKYQENPQDLAGAASRTLLGVQLQCAQCHDHKTEKWTQKDFEAFAAVFTRTRLEAIDRGRAMGMVRRVDVRDLDRTAPRFAKKMADLEGISRARPSALDGTNLGEGDDVRAALARWLTAPDNPWFVARARQPHVGSLPRARLRRSRRRSSAVESARRPRALRRARRGLRRRRVRREAPRARHRGNRGVRVLRRRARRRVRAGRPRGKALGAVSRHSARARRAPRRA